MLAPEQALLGAKRDETKSLHSPKNGGSNPPRGPASSSDTLISQVNVQNGSLPAAAHPRWVQGQGPRSREPPTVATERWRGRVYGHLGTWSPGAGHVHTEGHAQSWGPGSPCGKRFLGMDGCGGSVSQPAPGSAGPSDNDAEARASTAGSRSWEVLGVASV